MKVVLNEQELAFARYLAQVRQQYDEQVNATNKKATAKSDLDIAIMGFEGEFAVAKHLNLYPDFENNFQATHYDLITNKGVLIDVKTTDVKRDYVYVEGGKQPRNDLIYVFVLKLQGIYLIIGWQWSTWIIQEQYKKTIHTPCYQYPVKKLRRNFK